MSVSKAKRVSLNFKRNANESHDPNTLQHLFSNSPTLIKTRARPSVLSFKQISPENFQLPKINRRMILMIKTCLKSDDTVLALMSITGAIAAIISNDLFNENDLKSSKYIEYLRILVMFLSVLSGIWIFRRYTLKFDLGML